MRKMAVVTAGVVAAGLLTAGASQAISGGGVVPEGSYQFLARVTADGKSCSGALIDPRWVVTSASCLPQTGEVKVTVGTVTNAAKVVRHPDRDIAAVKLETATTGITPIALGGNALTQGETLKVGGFGRTATEWVPDRPRVATFTVSALTATTAALSGEGDTCKGDAGGPAFREVNGTPQLVALNKSSWQHGCLAVTETRQGSTETRVDNLDGWLEQQMLELTATAAPQHAITLSWAARNYQSFRVYASQSAAVPIGPSTLVGTVSTPSFTHAALTAKKTWYYKVVPVRDGQDGPTSAVVSATTALPTRSDFDRDGDDDIAAAYDHGNEQTLLPVWPGDPTGIGVPAFKWDSGAWGFDAKRARWVTGDFNGDGRSDVGTFYNYNGGTTKLLVVYANATGFDPWVEKWDSGAGNWPAQSARLIAGDYNGDGRVDIAAAYDLDGALTRMFVWYANATGFESPVQKWDSGAWGFDAKRARWVTGDFNGDGRSDVGAFYNYDGGTTKLLVFYANATGFNQWVEKWDSGAGNWPAQSARLIAGDYNGDGHSDIAAFYNLDNGLTRTFLWYGNATGFGLPVQQWDSGAGNWEAQGAQLL